MEGDNKGKAIQIVDEVVTLENINPKDVNKVIEVKVYRKWMAKKIPDLTPIVYCCMLLDRKGQAIQATINLKDVDKYNALELNSAYRIKGFGCQITEKWQQTLDSKLTLLFGRLTNLSHVPADNFPEHYFRFAAYNEVTGRADTNQFLLTGCEVQTGADGTTMTTHGKCNREAYGSLHVLLGKDSKSDLFCYMFKKNC